MNEHSVNLSQYCIVQLWQSKKILYDRSQQSARRIRGTARRESVKGAIEALEHAYLYFGIVDTEVLCLVKRATPKMLARGVRARDGFRSRKQLISPSLMHVLHLPRCLGRE